MSGLSRQHMSGLSRLHFFQLPFPSQMGSRIEISGYPSEHPAQNCATVFLYVHKTRENCREISEFAEEFAEFVKNSTSKKIGLLFFELEASRWRGSIRLVKAIWTSHRINSGYAGTNLIYQKRKNLKNPRNPPLTPISICWAVAAVAVAAVTPKSGCFLVTISFTNGV